LCRHQGRFLREDPLSFTAGDTNLYRYVFNSPVLLKDPTGEIVWLPLLIGAGVVLVGGAALFEWSSLPEKIGESNPWLSDYIGGPDNDWFGRCAHKIEERRFASWFTRTMEWLGVCGSLRYSTRVAGQAEWHTSSIWQKHIVRRLLGNMPLWVGKVAGRVFLVWFAFEAVWDTVVVIESGIETIFQR